MMQSYGSSAPDLIVHSEDSVNLNGTGLYKTSTYQTDIGNKSTVHSTGTSKPGYVVLPDASIQMLKPASTLTVVISYGAVGQTKQVYSLMGFTKVHDALVRCSPQQ
jgi:hypothetical protein